ncbi:hypothetical protein V5N11_017829 [Cardamine amara subsp. amara]|uniref:RNase H type-1 domain-containing protein n=1 Tax=Cardamine amara subsp. amara TaxID=228776 RepID=A0ABD0ZI68_CARAN
MQVWNKATIPLPQQQALKSTAEYMEYFLGLLEKYTIPVVYRQTIPWLLWGIWKKLNAKMYAGTVGDAYILIAQAIEEAEEWKRLNSTETVTASQRLNGIGLGKKWHRLPAGLLNSNVNSSWVNSSRMSGGSWIVRDHIGEVKFHGRDVFLPAQNRIAAELRCILLAMQSLLNLQVIDLEIWSEIGAVIEAINNPCQTQT